MPTSTDNQDYGASDAANEKNVAKPSETATGPAVGNMPLGSENDEILTEEGYKNKTGAATGPAAGNLPLSDKADDTLLSSDDFKGKKVDADPSTESGKPAESKGD